MTESFEQMVRSLHTKMPMATQEDAIAFATRIKEELYKGQEPVNCDLASTFGNFCQCKNHKLYLHPAPIPADMLMVPVWVLKTAQNLANHMAKKFYPEVAGFGVLDDLAGVISQIDNMVCGIPTEAMIAAYEGEKK